MVSVVHRSGVLPSVSPVFLLTLVRRAAHVNTTHQGAALDAVSVHFRLSINDDGCVCYKRRSLASLPTLKHTRLMYIIIICTIFTDFFTVRRYFLSEPECEPACYCIEIRQHPSLKQFLHYETSMSILVNLGRKCTPAASRAAALWVTSSIGRAFYRG